MLKLQLIFGKQLLLLNITWKCLCAFGLPKSLSIEQATTLPWMALVETHRKPIHKSCAANKVERWSGTHTLVDPKRKKPGFCFLQCRNSSPAPLKPLHWNQMHTKQQSVHWSIVLRHQWTSHPLRRSAGHRPYAPSHPLIISNGTHLTMNTTPFTY